jgi:hypothetical protein
LRSSAMLSHRSSTSFMRSSTESSRRFAFIKNVSVSILFNEHTAGAELVPSLHFCAIRS